MSTGGALARTGGGLQGGPAGGLLAACRCGGRLRTCAEPGGASCAGVAAAACSPCACCCCCCPSEPDMARSALLATVVRCACAGVMWCQHACVYMRKSRVQQAMCTLNHAEFMS